MPSEIQPGNPAIFDPKDKSRIHSVEKRGEFYTVKGESGGRPVSIEIHAKDVETRSKKDAEALFRRGLLGTANQQREGTS